MSIDEDSLNSYNEEVSKMSVLPCCLKYLILNVFSIFEINYSPLYLIELEWWSNIVPRCVSDNKRFKLQIHEHIEVNVFPFVERP